MQRTNNVRGESEPRPLTPSFGLTFQSRGRCRLGFSQFRECLGQALRHMIENERELTMAVKDPICGMMIEQADAVATSEYKGKTYYFCSMDCKEEFDSAPEDYA